MGYNLRKNSVLLTLALICAGLQAQTDIGTTDLKDSIDGGTIDGRTTHKRDPIIARLFQVSARDLTGTEELYEVTHQIVDASDSQYIDAVIVDTVDLSLLWDILKSNDSYSRHNVGSVPARGTDTMLMAIYWEPVLSSGMLSNLGITRLGYAEARRSSGGYIIDDNIQGRAGITDLSALQPILDIERTAQFDSFASSVSNLIQKIQLESQHEQIPRTQDLNTSRRSPARDTVTEKAPARSNMPDSTDKLQGESSELRASSGGEPNYAAPLITSLSSTNVGAGGGDQLTIEGLDFGFLQGQVEFESSVESLFAPPYIAFDDVDILLWTNTSVTLRIPSRARYITTGPLPTPLDGIFATGRLSVSAPQ